LFRKFNLCFFLKWLLEFLEKKSVQEWNVHDVGLWLETIHCSEYKEIFKQHDITGPELIKLEKHDLSVSFYILSNMK